MKKEIVTANQVEQFCNLVNKGVEAWVEAGKLLVRIVDNDHAAFDKISAVHPHLTSDILESFERIGRGEIYPYLLVDGSPGARKLAGLPYKSQVTLYNGTVDVVIKKVNGFETHRMKVRDLTAVQAARVFDVNRIRDANEQRKLFIKPARRYNSTPISRDEGDAMAEEEEETPGACDLAENPKMELAKLLLRAQQALLDARTSLAIIRNGSPLDEFITRALTEVGRIRFAVKENEF